MNNNSDNYSIYDDRLKLDQIAYGGATPEEGQKKKKQKADAKKEYKENVQRRSIIGIVAVIVGSLAVSFLPFGLMNFIWGPVIAAAAFGIIEGICYLNNNNKKQEQLMEETRKKEIKEEEKRRAVELENKLADLKLKQALANQLDAYYHNSMKKNPGRNYARPHVVQDPTDVHNNTKGNSRSNRNS